jgi:hypothetical protein
MVELPDGDCELTLHLDTGISGRSLRAIVSLPPTIDRARAVAALFDSTSPDALRRGFVGDGGIVEFDDLESGTYTLCIQASTTDLGEKALHSQAVTLSDADVHLGIVEVGTKKRTTLHLPEAARTGSGIVRIGCTSCPGGKLSPLTEHILLRANAERPLVIHGLPVGKYELINAQGGATYVFVSEVVAGNEEPAVQAR